METDSLRKPREIPNHVAAVVFVVCAYAAAAITTAIETGMVQRVVGGMVLVTATVIVFMTLVFILSRILGRTDIIDAAWGPAFIVAAISSFTIGHGGSHELGWNVQTLASVLVIIWGVRLCYVITRRLMSHPEDKRYIELRKHWRGNEMLNAYVRVFLVQAVLASIISIAVIHINLTETMLITPLAIIGAVVWAVGFLFEAIGDYQLKRFLARPANKGKLMTEGLWHYTRHPNYFGEATQWWGIALISLTTMYGWVGLITPIVITYLLLFISGVPMTEKAFSGKPGWQKYKRQTSKFLPLPVKR